MKKFLAVMALAAFAAWVQAEDLGEESAVAPAGEADVAVAQTVQEEPADGELATAAAAGVRAGFAVAGVPGGEGVTAESVRIAAAEAVVRALDPRAEFRTLESLREELVQPVAEDASVEEKQAAERALLRWELPCRDRRLVVRVKDGGAAAWDAGLWVLPCRDGVRVASVREGGAAAAAGVEAGWTVCGVDGKSAAEVQAWLEGGDEARLEAEFATADGERKTAVLERTAAAWRSVAESGVLPTGIGYVRLRSVEHDAGNETAALLKEWGETVAGGVVLDLRGAGGESYVGAVDTAALFAPAGTELWQMEALDGENFGVGGAKEGLRLHSGPLMLLTDGQTRRAGELLAAALAGQKGVMVLGGEGAGDPMVREWVGLTDGVVAWTAVRRLVAGGGREYVGQEGVRPDVEIGEGAYLEEPYEPREPRLRKGKTLSEEEIEDRALRDRTRYDAVLRRATDIVLGLRAMSK